MSPGELIEGAFQPLEGGDEAPPPAPPVTREDEERVFAEALDRKYGPRTPPAG